MNNNHENKRRPVASFNPDPRWPSGHFQALEELGAAQARRRFYAHWVRQFLIDMAISKGVLLVEPRLTPSFPVELYYYGLNDCFYLLVLLQYILISHGGCCVKIVKNILFPIRFTNYSIDILEYVILLARSVRAKLHLLHVITSEESPSFDELNEFFHTIKNHPKGDAARNALDQLDLIKIHIKDRDVEKGIIRYAAEGEIDMIMMAAHAPGAAPGKPLGRIVRHVLDSGPCPVMVIRLPEDRSRHQSRFEMTLQEIKRDLASKRL